MPNPSAFRADPTAAPANRPSRRQALALLTVLAVVAATFAAVAGLVRPEGARAFDLFAGSLFLTDQNAPVAVDLATGKPTLRLLGADAQVGVTSRAETLGIVPLDERTLLLNETTGEFNMVDSGGFVVKHDNGGVPLAHRGGKTSALAVASDDGEAYIVRTGTSGGTDVYLVGQPTVEAAIDATRGVQPRAGRTLPQPVSTAPGTAAAAGGGLWLLAGTGTTRTLEQLTVPANSSTGATLGITGRGTVTGPAALAGANGTIAVASASDIRVFTASNGTHTASFRAPAGLDSVLPATNAGKRLGFLLHGTTGWSVVSIGVDGTGLRGPARLSGVPAGAQLLQPAISNGWLYTMDRGSGRLLRIGFDGAISSIPGAASYPLSLVRGRVVEPADYADAYLIARGARVIVNSASHVNALMIFTDGSHAPLRIPKSSAVTLNASSGAEALTRAVGTGTGKPSTTKGNRPKPKPQPVQPINNKINCRTATQKPHIPVITSALPGSRTVALTWTYPVLDPQDCYPSTYVVSVQLLSADAPQPPASVTVQSQTGTNLVGLFPSSRYDVTVTAYINGQGTSSTPVPITTGPEGPAAPNHLAVAADDKGDWTVTFDSCGTVQQGCVPAQSWTVTPSICDGRGLSSPPTPMSVSADPTSRVQPTVTYKGGDALLGRGLRFQVQGTGEQGQAGTPSARTGCVYSWSAPVAADISVQASAPPAAGGPNATTSTTVTTTFAKGAVHDLGGAGGTLTYVLKSGDTVVSQVGPTTQPTALLTGIRAGQTYQVYVTAAPPQHPEAAVTIGPVAVQPAAMPWPTVTVDTPTFDAPPGIDGTLHVTFHFSEGTDTRGETFDLVNSRLTCGNSAMTLDASDVAPGDALSFDVSRVLYRGDCTVTLQLTQDAHTATSPPLYGAGYSAAVTSPLFHIDAPSLTGTANDFTAQWTTTPDGNPAIVLSYHGGDDLAGASNWQLAVSNGSRSCGTSASAPPVTIPVDPTCVPSGGPFTVAVDYTYFLIGHAHFVVQVQGTAPQPVDPGKISFSAAWNTNRSLPQVVVTYTGSQDPSAFATLKWTEAVTSSASPGASCASDTDNPAGSTIRIDVNLAACPPRDSAGMPAVYTVEVSFTDPIYGRTGDYKYTVQGVPPT